MSEPTLRKVEHGDPSVALGTALKVAALAGVPLFGVDAEHLAELSDRVKDPALRSCQDEQSKSTDHSLDDGFVTPEVADRAYVWMSWPRRSS